MKTFKHILFTAVATLALAACSGGDDGGLDGGGRQGPDKFVWGGETHEIVKVDFKEYEATVNSDVAFEIYVNNNTLRDENAYLLTLRFPMEWIDNSKHYWNNWVIKFEQGGPAGFEYVTTHSSNTVATEAYISNGKIYVNSLGSDSFEVKAELYYQVGPQGSKVSKKMEVYYYGDINKSQVSPED